MSDILFLAHRVPFPPNRGDKIRAHHVLKRLAQLGRVHVGCFSENAEDRGAQAELAELAATYCAVPRRKPLVLAGVQALLTGKPVSLTAFDNSELKHWVYNTLKNHPVSTIVVFSGQMGQYVPDNSAGQVIIDLCDVDSVKFEDYAETGQRPWLNRREGRLLRREEERLAQRADATILISKAEAFVFKSRLSKPDNARIEVIGNGINASLFDPSKVSPTAEITAQNGPHFVFTGQMDYPPNEAAALWVIDALLPELRQHFPNSQFHVVGRNPTPALRAKRDVPGLTIWGEVEDVRPFIAAADCVLAPLLIARGVQNKVLEAMAMARPVVLTPQAATGIDAQHAEHWLQCEADADEMAADIAALLKDQSRAAKLGQAARQFVLAHHSWDAMLDPLERFVRGMEGCASDAA